MKFKEIFKSEEDYKKIREILGENAETFESEFDTKELAMVPHSRFNEVNNKKKEAMDANEQLKKQLEKLEKENITPDDYKKKTQEIIDGYEAKIKGIEEEGYKFRRDYAIRDALAVAKAKHPDLLAKQLDVAKIKENAGKFEGIEEQITALKKDYADLFETDEGNNGQKGSAASIYSGLRRQSLTAENEKIVDMFKEGFFPDSSND